MAVLMYLLALVCFVVQTFGGHIGTLDLIALGLSFLSAGLLLGGGVEVWIRKQVKSE